MRAAAVLLAALGALLLTAGPGAASPPEPQPQPMPPAVTIADSLNFQRNLPGRTVWAAPGMDADMPCNVTPPNPKDRVNMVLWFKDSEGVPLYSLDNRNGDLEKAEHGAIARPKTGKGRYFFQTSASGVPLPPSGPRASPHNWEQPDEGVTLEPKVARLRILNVSAEDEGVFRCRVDFLDSPTTNFRVKLTLATPPSAPVIYNKNGVEVGALAGPFQEGYDLQLSCSVTNGHPRPVVTWWLGDTLLDDMVETKTSSETINRLTLPAVTREHLGAVLQCRAAPLPGAPYQHRDVTLDVYLKPKRVQIMTALETLPAGRPRQVQCETSGSVPAAQVTWLLDGEALRNDAVTVTDDRHLTISTVTLVATPKDDGRELACRAENPRVPGGFMEDRRKIRVAHAPEVTISLASEKSADQLMEGDEVRLRCDVRANPPPDKVSWYHGNHLLRQDSEPQPSHPGRRLYVVRDLGPSSAGEYSCAASNREGTGRSDPVSISVQYSPRCRQGFDNRRVGALKGTPVQVRCEVLAEPADVRFSWTFNRSKDGSVAVPAHKVETNGTVSYLAYTPNGDNDFGTLGCWASNSVGRILVPCYVHVVAATAPRPPEACSVRNRTSSPGAAAEMEVKCIAGADGGLRQHFRLEVYEAVDEADGGDPDRDPDRDPYGWDEDKSNEITGGHLSLEAAHGRAPGSGLGDTGSGSGSGSGAGPPGSGSALGQGELWDASASRRKPVLEVEAGPEPFWTLQTHKLEPGRRYEILLYAVNDKGSSEPAVSLHAVAPPSAEVINGVELRGNMMSRPPLDALASGGGGAPGHQTAPVAVVLGALIACAALILAAVALAVTLVVCRRRREARREAEEARRRDDFREAVRGSQVVVGSLKRQPVTPGEEDQFGILVTATSPNSSVVGIREGQQQSPPPLQQHTGTLGRPHIPAVGAAAAARSLGTMGPPMGSPMGHQPPMGHHGYPMAHPMPHPAAHPAAHPAMMERLRHEDPAGPTPPMAHMAPSMATTIIGSGGGVLNRIRNNNDPDLIISRAEVVLKPLNTSRC